MDTQKNIGISVVVALVVSVFVSIVSLSIHTPVQAPEQPAVAMEELSGVSVPSHNTPESFSKGLFWGDDYLNFAVNGTIGAGSNQGSWRNKTGRTVYVSAKEVYFGFLSGTASSSDLLYVATSTSATLSNDYTTPSGDYLLMSGGSFATSSYPVLLTGTTTPLGRGIISIPDGSYLNFQVQEKFGCKTVGACETATSTNRGITNFVWRFVAHYKP